MNENEEEQSEEGMSDEQLFEGGELEEVGAVEHLHEQFHVLRCAIQPPCVHPSQHLLHSLARQVCVCVCKYINIRIYIYIYATLHIQSHILYIISRHTSRAK